MCSKKLLGLKNKTVMHEFIFYMHEFVGYAGWMHDFPEKGLPDGRYFIANLVEAGKRTVFWKSVLESGISKINNLP